MEFEQKRAPVPQSVRERIEATFVKKNERQLAHDVMSHILGSGGQAKIRLSDFNDMGGAYHLGAVRAQRVAEDLLEHNFLQYRASGWRGGGRLFILHPELPLTGTAHTNQEPKAQEETTMACSNPYSEAIAAIRNFTSLSPVEAMPVNMAKGVLLDVIEVVGGVLGPDAVMTVLADLDRKEVAPEVPA